MPPLLIVLIAVVAVGGMLVWAGALADAAQYDDATFSAAGRAKASTLALVALTWAFGGIYYWTRIKPVLKRV